MLIPKNRLIFGIIRKIIKGIGKVLSFILGVFNLEWTFILLIIGVILWLTGAFKSLPWLVIVFFAVLGLSVIYSMWATIKKLFKLGKKSSGGKVIEIENQYEDATSRPDGRVTSNVVDALGNTERVERDVNPYAERVYSTSVGTSEIPKYFAVRQNPNYVMAEYSDKYVLYVKTAGGLKLVRVDRKRG